MWTDRLLAVFFVELATRYAPRFQSFGPRHDAYDCCLDLISKRGASPPASSLAMWTQRSTTALMTVSRLASIMKRQHSKAVWQRLPDIHAPAFPGTLGTDM